jgi:NitT/TauT family transport system permease protein
VTPAVKRALFFLLILAAWEGVYQLALWPDVLLPSPFRVLDALKEGLLEKGYLGGVLVSLRRIALGYGLSILVGMALGILLASSRTLEDTLGTLVVSLQTLPSICWLPLAVLWYGLSEKAILFVVIMGSLLAVTMATKDGIRRVSPLLISAARTMGARGLRLHLHVTLPAAFPSIVDGMKQGWSFAWRSLMAGELLFGTLGLGHHLQMGRELNDMSQVIAVMLLIVALGILVDLVIFAALERRIRERWGLQKD